ncbi:MAG: hypothetical protein MUF80_04375 [Burkholderiales bacterium]|nr:hypothetical protein [Burkholderiales bacterium]
MRTAAVIALGQQPCGFFPKRFFHAKLATARRLQREIGGEIVYFCHDSDHDPRETRTTVRHRKTGEATDLNFAFENQIQRRFSPLHLKRVPAGWQETMARQLPAFVTDAAVEAFKSVRAGNVADFCLEMYWRMGLLDGVRVVRSSDPAVRRAACEVDDYFVDVVHEGEVVRARFTGGVLRLHVGGDRFIDLPACSFGTDQVSPTRDTRLRWMQSVLHCTHYVAGASEQDYLRRDDAPEITYINRDPIDCSDEAWTECLA